MRVVQVVAGLAWNGGVQEYVSGLSRGLSDLGHEVIVLTGGLGPPDGPPAHALAEGLDIRWHAKRRVLNRYTYPSGLASSVRELSSWADVVHTHQPFFVGTWLAASTRTRLATTFYLHPEHVAGRSGGRRRVELNILLRRVDLVVAVSATELDLIRSIRRPRRDCVAWPALDASDFGRSEQVRSQPLVLSVGRLSMAKGSRNMLRALASLSTDCEVLVVGDGPDRAACEDICMEFGLNAPSILVGSLSDQEVAALYRQADVFVSVSSQESFGIAALKAIAGGCRPVLSDIPSHREIIETLGLDAGYLIPPHADPEQIALAIETALMHAPTPEGVIEGVPTWTDTAANVARAYESIDLDLTGNDAGRIKSERL